VTQLKGFDVPFTDDFPGAMADTDQIIDAIFGFSFSGEVREPFPAIIEAMKNAKVPVTAVDIPSSWDVDDGPPSSGPGNGFVPSTLISLTAPKPCSAKFQGRHFIGGRFLSAKMAEKYGVEVPSFEGTEQNVEVTKGMKL
jgi:NAD(P)H-hydrate epimerase